jgi:large subunit ribosomal protein L9
MEVILLEKVHNLGALGDLVKVKSGYARNFLIPGGKATRANAENKAKFEQHRRELEVAAADKLTQARARAEKMAGVVATIARRSGEDGKLFGSVTNHDIADAVTAQGVELAKSEIHLPHGPLKELGEFEVPVSLHADVHLTLKVQVVEEKA